MNAVAGKTTDWNLHWTDGPGRNHYGFIWTGKRDRLGREIRRRLTSAELNRAVNLWGDADIHRWRKTLSPIAPRRSSRQRKRLHKDRPGTVHWRSLQAKALRVTIGWELKSASYGTSPTLVDRFIKSASAARGQWFGMTLATMANARGKRDLFEARRAPFVVLGRIK